MIIAVLTILFKRYPAFQKSGSVEYFDWIMLEKEALRITGNLEENELNEVELKFTSWRPAGNIRVFDDIISK